MYNLMDLLFLVSNEMGSDLHIIAGLPPMMRVNRVLRPLGAEALTEEDTKGLAYSVLNQRQIENFEANLELDCAISINDIGRCRLNIFKQQGRISLALRIIPHEFYTFEQLRLPNVVYDLVNLQKGLVLITGATGSGKTTTLASMINYINEHRKSHIITIEDPIEYIHKHKNCIVNQREVGTDTKSFAAALKSVLRQDPDIILIGEMRDLETISSAITIAETGHLVFATLHTMDSSSSIDRIVSVFPASQQEQIRVQLAQVLQAIFSQQLVPHISGKGMVLISEVMIINDSVKNIIREQKTEQLYSVIQTSRQIGMQTMNQSLIDGVNNKLISPQVAFNYSLRKKELESLLKDI